MKRIIQIFLLILPGLNILAQSKLTTLEGTVSYITSQNVYVKFESTIGINKGDTLFISGNEMLRPVLVVNDLSSISCVCSPVSGLELKVSETIIANTKAPEEPEAKEKQVVKDSLAAPNQIVADTSAPAAVAEKKLKQDIHGRLGISSYTNFSNTPASNSQKMRYTYSMLANNLGNSKLSAEVYISFAHDNIHWDEVKKNVFYGLKIYNAAFRYDFNDSTHLWFGRKINPRLSSMGANDGLQFEKKFGSVTAGIIAGLRPDYQDYGFNSNLFQLGAFVSYDYKGRAGNMQNTLAFIDQTNSWKTDRRYLYFQHSNNLAKNLYVFGTLEMELYQKLNEQAQNTFKLSNFYLMLRYKIIKQLSVSVSYSTRKNMIFYETYKDLVANLQNREATQGYRLQVTYRPIRFLSLGVSGAYRFSKQDPEPSKNMYAYLTYSRIPGLNISTTLSATIMKTAYISGKIYNIGFTKDLFKGKVNAGINYRYIHYDYVSSEIKTLQHVGEANLNWIILRKLSLGIYYEGTFEGSYTFNRIYVNLTKRF